MQRLAETIRKTTTSSPTTPTARAIFFRDMARILDMDARQTPEVPRLLELGDLHSVGERPRVFAGEVLGDGVEDALLHRGREARPQHAEEFGRRHDDQPIVAALGQPLAQLLAERVREP